MEKSKICPFCGERIKLVAIKCKYCGSVLTGLDNKTKPNISTYIKTALASKYEILSEVGRGGMSVIYKALQKNLDRIVALKVLSYQLANDNEYIERFHQEARVAAKLSHPNIINIFDEDSVNEVHYISMEYLEGKDLNTRIREQGTLSLDEILNIMIPIASALSYVHKKGLIHRDIKSANIFLHKDSRVILTDFGIAHANREKELTVSGTILGTPEFMSPEQARGERIDSRSDIYSLGVVMYHSFTGRFPYSADNPLVTISKILSGNYAAIHSIKNIPNWLESIIDGCMHKDKEKRIQNGDELITLLKEKKTYNQMGNVHINKTNELYTVKLSPYNRSYLSKEKNIFPGPWITRNEFVRKIKSSNYKLSSAVLFLCIIVVAVIVLIMSSKISSTNNSVILAPVQNSSYQDPRNIPSPIDSIKENDSVKYKTKESVKDHDSIEETLVSVPDIKSSQIDAAKKIIKSSGLNYTIQEIDNSENIGFVIGQSLNAGDKVKKGTQIVLIVGK